MGLTCEGSHAGAATLSGPAGSARAISTSVRSRGELPEFGARGELHLKRRSFARRRHHPDAPAVHLDDLLGDCGPKARATLGLGVGTVDLMELLEDAGLMLFGNAWPCISRADVEVAVDRLGSHAHLAGEWQSLPA